jgi:hypothetical protein
MLKRNGQRSAHAKSLVKADHLTRGELDAYSEAIEAIEGELEELQHVKDSVKGLLDDPVIFTIPGGPDSDGIIEIPNVPADRWRISSSLLKLRNSQIFLCDRKIQGAKEFAIIERFNADSPYAQANREAEVLLVGDDPVLLVQDYAARAEHTLQFMASNLVSKAHRIVWARYASTSPARVISVIFAQCAEAASMGNGVGETAEHSGQVQPPRQAAAQNRITHAPA